VKHPKLTRGDVIEVDWVDIFEDSVGDPRKPRLAKRTSIARFWAWTRLEGVQALVTTTTVERNVDGGNEGYCAYPRACVRRISVIAPAAPKEEACPAS
jgi:hypothetical protein